MRIGILLGIKRRIWFKIKREIKMIMENMGFYVSECEGEPPSITPPVCSKRLDSPRPFPTVFPHTS